MIEALHDTGPAWLEWFTRGAALRRAREAAPSAELALALNRVDGLLELVELALEPPEPFHSGDPNDALMLLLSEAFRVAGGAHLGLPAGASTGAVVEAWGADALAAFVPADASLPDLVAWLGEGRAECMAGLSVTEADERIALCRAFVRASVAHVGAARVAVRALESQRRKRPLAAAVGLVVVAAMAFVGARRALAVPDLAAGKTYTASSAIGGFPTSGIVNVPVDFELFVHTREEDSPWLRIDLGRMETFRSIEIANRADCCRDRAAPLLVQSSDNGETWNDLGQRTDEFSEWTLSFNPTTARYVRVSVPRRSFLHLARVSVRR